MFKLTPKQHEALKIFQNHPLNALLSGGSRSGKTTFIIYIMILTALKYNNSRQLISRQHLSDLVPSIIEDTFPKVVRMINPALKHKINLNRKYMFAKFPNESEIWFTGLSNHDKAEKALGNEYIRIYFNEATQLLFETYEKLQTRLAQNIPGFRNQFVLDCNPTHRAHWLYEQFVTNTHPESKNSLDANENRYLVMNPIDNIANLPDGYINHTLANLSTSKRLRFLEGEWQNEIDGALWRLDYIKRAKAPQCTRICIGVDPAGTKKGSSDETGIVATGEYEGKGYVLADRSLKGSPNEWGRAVVKLHDELQADRIVCEVNFGGDLVKSNLNTIRPNLPIVQVRASKGKAVRAEPVVALYEQNKVRHCGYFRELENQMVGWTPDDTTMSPDRLDALVWAFYDLMLNKKREWSYAV